MAYLVKLDARYVNPSTVSIVMPSDQGTPNAHCMIRFTNGQSITVRISEEELLKKLCSDPQVPDTEDSEKD